MLQLLRPTNSTEEIQEYWAKSQQVNEPRIWDVSLFRVLFSMRMSTRFAVIYASLDREIQDAFWKTVCALF